MLSAKEKLDSKRLNYNSSSDLVALLVNSGLVHTSNTSHLSQVPILDQMKSENSSVLPRGTSLADFSLPPSYSVQSQLGLPGHIM